MARDFNQSSEEFLAALDAEISRLQTIREHVTVAFGTPARSEASPARKRRGGMSEEGRRKIAEAQKARWAKQKAAAEPAGKRASTKRAAGKKAPAKKAPAKKRAAKKAVRVKAETAE